MFPRYSFKVSFMVPGEGFKELAVKAECREAAVETVRMYNPQAVAIEVESVIGRVAAR